MSPARHESSETLGCDSPALASPIASKSAGTGSGLERLLGIYDLQLGQCLVRMDKDKVLCKASKKELLKRGGTRLLDSTVFHKKEKGLRQQMLNSLSAT